MRKFKKCIEIELLLPREIVPFSENKGIEDTTVFSYPKLHETRVSMIWKTGFRIIDLTWMAF